MSREATLSAGWSEPGKTTVRPRIKSGAGSELVAGRTASVRAGREQRSVFRRFGWPGKVAGGSPAAGYFSCLAKKSNQKKATPLHRPFGVPCVARATGRLPPKVTSFGARNSRTDSITGCWFWWELPVVLARPARSHSARRLPPAALRYSAAQKGVLENGALLLLLMLIFLL